MPGEVTTRVLLERCFGEPDEIWVPYGDDGNLLKSPRYAGNAVPEDIECDCIWNGIDEALKVAGFGRWMSSSKLVDVAQLDSPFWKRLGQRQRESTTARKKQR